MAEVFDVTRQQLKQWASDNWQGFTYDDHRVEDLGARWLLVDAHDGMCGTKFTIAADPDMTAQTRKEVCELVDDYNENELEDLAAGGDAGVYEWEAWHVVDALPADDDFTVKGAELQAIESIATALVNIYRDHCGYGADKGFMDGEGRYVNVTDDHAEGLLYWAQEIRDVIGDIARRHD